MFDICYIISDTYRSTGRYLFRFGGEGNSEYYLI